MINIQSAAWVNKIVQQKWFTTHGLLCICAFVCVCVTLWWLYLEQPVLHCVVLVLRAWCLCMAHSHYTPQGSKAIMNCSAPTWLTMSLMLCVGEDARWICKRFAWQCGDRVSPSYQVDQLPIRHGRELSAVTYSQTRQRRPPILSRLDLVVDYTQVLTWLAQTEGKLV